MFSHTYTDVPMSYSRHLSKRTFGISYDSAEKNIGNCITVQVLKINGVHFFWSKLLLNTIVRNVHSETWPCSVIQVFKREVLLQVVYKVVDYEV